MTKNQAAAFPYRCVSRSRRARFRADAVFTSILAGRHYSDERRGDESATLVSGARRSSTARHLFHEMLFNFIDRQVRQIVTELGACQRWPRQFRYDPVRLFFRSRGRFRGLQVRRLYQIFRPVILNALESDEAPLLKAANLVRA
jgi:hypothetical protein